MAYQKHRLFSDLSTVSRSNRIHLLNEGLINKNDSVVGWTRLAPKLTSRELTQLQAKALVLLEIESAEPREDIIKRLVSYLSYSGKEQTLDAINKILTK